MGTEEVRDCLYPMGWTSENVSKDFGITRERMDELAAASQQRAGVAQSNGYFDSEIVPLDVWQKQAGSDQRTKVRVAKDDGIRGDSSAEKLGKIRAAFPQWGNGTTTGGNASQITDGAAAVLLMKRSKAEELGLEILGKHVCTSVAGLPPRIMGIVRASPSAAHSRLMLTTSCVCRVLRLPSPRLSRRLASPRRTWTSLR